MRQALVPKAQRGVRRSAPDSVPAPIKGWNARDPLAAMDPQFAITLDNMFPRTADIQFRRGSVTWATGFPGAVDAFLPYNAATTKKLFAASGTGVYEVTAGGAIGASVATITSTHFITTNVRTAAVSAMYAVNGSDKPLYYNGATWVSVDGASTPALTVIPSTSTLNYVDIHKNRLWFVQKNTMSLWYLPTGQIGGALAEFPVGMFFKRGGFITAIGTLTFDGGDGSDDYFAVISSEGEVALYQGTDPSSVSTWSLVGVYFVGKPLQTKCLVKYGGDLMYLNAAGAAPLTKLLQSATIDRSQEFSYNIENAFLAAAQISGGTFGWEAVLFPEQSALIVNVPTGDGTTFVQYVMNTITKAWCRFRDWNARTFVVFDGVLYYGGANTVIKAWTGLDDMGNNITFYAKTAFNYFRSALEKRWTLLRPVLTADNRLPVSIGLSVDFEDNTDFSTIDAFGIAYSKWDLDLWDVGIWGAGSSITQDWRTAAAKVGKCAAFRLYVASKSVDLTWISVDYIYETGTGK